MRITPSPPVPPGLSPSAGTPGEVTVLLAEWAGGDRAALGRLLPLVYDELRRLAHLRLARERPGHTLDSRALVHETYLKLSAGPPAGPADRARFFAVAARSMRTILIDHARAHLAARRGGGAVRMSLEDAEETAAVQRDERLMALDDALARLAEVSDEACRTVEYRYFAGLTTEEIAEALGTSPATVRRRWDFARAWLRRELAAGG
jgi:RNA polymerase sigma factor (TIGR02999 family)